LSGEYKIRSASQDEEEKAAVGFGQRIILGLGQAMDISKDKIIRVDIVKSRRFNREFGVVHLYGDYRLIVPDRIAKQVQEALNDDKVKLITIARASKGFGRYTVITK